MAPDIHFDFSAALLLLAVVTGVFTLMGKLLNKAKGDDYKENTVIEYSRSFFPVILLVLVLRSFLAEPFRIPSGSMLPTLEPGDFVLVNKFSYGIRMPVFHNKLVDLGSPERGDVAVFRYPHQPEVDYIKRVIGLPGDKITWVNKQLYVNDVLQPLTGEKEYADDKTHHEYTEVLENGVEHQILHDLTARSKRSGDYYVPEGQYFVMGDNRDHSNDSRYWRMVPDRNLVGRAFFIWMNFGSFDRIGTTIK